MLGLSESGDKSLLTYDAYNITTLRDGSKFMGTRAGTIDRGGGGEDFFSKTFRGPKNFC